MKKIIYYSMVLYLAFAGITAHAQHRKSVGNIASQPLWGPVGYNNVVYYFIPDIESYYNVDEKKFIYLENGKWTFSDSLPSIYKDYDLYSGYKVVINRPQPYFNFRAHRVRYANYLGQKNKQIAIADSKNSKYFVVHGHPHADSEEKISLNKE